MSTALPTPSLRDALRRLCDISAAGSSADSHGSAAILTLPSCTMEALPCGAADWSPLMELHPAPTHLDLSLLREAATGQRLSSLSGFPKLSTLLELEVCDSQIEGGLEALAALSALRRLSLANNPLRTLATLVPLAKLPALRELELYGCPVTWVEDCALTADSLRPPGHCRPPPR